MRLIIIILLGLGICFRLVNLDHKIYWYDETFTSLRSSGYTEAEVVEHFSQSAIVQVPDLQHYQQPDPQRGLGEMWHSLATEDPQHPPLYYALSTYWIRWVGSSVTAMRLLPALLSLLALPCAYWLCQELFATTEMTGKFEVAGMAIGLLAVSPFHVLYAQEAREYSLWSVTALLATAALLRGLRVGTVASWLIYALALAASLYTFLFSIWMAVAHAIYVLALAKFRFSSTVTAYLLATLLALAAFSPWIWIAGQNLNQIETVTDWTTHNRSIVTLATSWASMLGRLFYDRGTTALDRTIQVNFIVLIALAFHTLCRHTPKSVWLLLVTLTVVPISALVLPDLLEGGRRSTAPRYLIPALCSIQLTVAYLLATKTIISHSKQGAGGSKTQQRWRWITAAVLTAGILSNLTIAQAPTWWIKPHNQDNLAIAQTINPLTHPLLISDAETADLLSLSYVLDADTDLLIRPRCYTCPIDSRKAINPSILEISQDYSQIFLFHPRATKEWKRSLNQIQNYQTQPYRLEVALPDSAETLWRLVSDD